MYGLKRLFYFVIIIFFLYFYNSSFKFRSLFFQSKNNSIFRIFHRALNLLSLGRRRRSKHTCKRKALFEGTTYSIQVEYNKKKNRMYINLLLKKKIKYYKRAQKESKMALVVETLAELKSTRSYSEGWAAGKCCKPSVEDSETVAFFSHIIESLKRDNYESQLKIVELVSFFFFFNFRQYF